MVEANGGGPFISPRVLLVDDDRELCQLLATFLAAEQFRVTLRHNGRDGLQQALDGAFDLVLLDVMMPALNGFEVLRQIRRRSAIPVILLTARTAHEDRMAGFRGGADDYLPKPFHPEELLARCQALLRRVRGPLARVGSANPEAGSLRLDLARRQAFAGDEQLELTGMELDILDLLVRGAGRIVTREEIWAALYQREPNPLERSLDTHMSNLRRKLGGRGGVAIRTIRNTGYLLAVVE